jgi:protein phosphatase
VWAGILVAVLVVALVGLRLYLDSQWYVGASSGHVAIFRGIPTEVAGFELHHVVVETTIPAGQAESLAVYRDLGDGITAEDRERASAIVEQIRRDVERLQQIPKPNQPDSSNVSGS